MKNIIIKGARQHNLKNINVEIPRDKLVVITGVSAPGNRRLRSTRSMQKDSDDMLNRSPRTPASSSG